jgi:hypothetical protein
MKLISIIAALLFLNIAMAACTRGATGELCTAPETQEALQQLLRDEYSSFLANLGEDPEDTPAFDVPIASVVLVSVNAETGLVECSAGIGETAAEVRYAVTPNLTRPGHYVYRLTYMAPPAALEILRAAGRSERSERPAATPEVEQPEAADQAPSPEILAEAIVGVWRLPNEYCDSGAPISYAESGRLQGFGMEGRWRAEGDVLTEHSRVFDDVEDEAAGWTDYTTVSQIRMIGSDRLLVTPLDGRADPYELVRCPSA